MATRKSNKPAASVAATVSDVVADAAANNPPAEVTNATGAAPATPPAPPATLDAPTETETKPGTVINNTKARTGPPSGETLAARAMDAIRKAIPELVKEVGDTGGMWRQGMAEIEAKLQPNLIIILPRAAAGDREAVLSLQCCRDVVHLRAKRLGEAWVGSAKERLKQIVTEAVVSVIPEEVRAAYSIVNGVITYIGAAVETETTAN